MSKRQPILDKWALLELSVILAVFGSPLLAVWWVFVGRREFPEVVAMLAAIVQ